MDAYAEGTELGRYRLGRLIGSGGMGEVYLARDGSLRRDVAIKFVNATAGSSDVLTRRLLQEAQAVAALDHPGICPVHDVGTDSTGRPYMVMQYVPGETLATRLARGSLPVADTLRISAQIADALAAAHRRNIIHRDLKPQNVMLTPAGQTKLLDFGIAKVLPTAEGVPTETTVTSLTQPHAIVGTPAYMSPEQIQQQPLDGRSDLFSLGCILFECLTGRRAFEGTQSLDVLGQVLHVQPPAPSTVRRELDDRHDELCRRLLAKDPAERFQTAEEVVGALTALQGDSLGERPRRDVLTLIRAQWKLVVAVSLVAIAAVAGFWIATRPRLPAPSADAVHYYQLGTDALREGAFHKAAAALTEAVRLSPNYPLAYARLAEAHAEMDDERAAAQDLLNVSSQVPDATRLPRDERLRFDAIRALVLGQADAAVVAYRELATRSPKDARAWVDLSRAQRSAEQLSDARLSLERAASIDPLYASAHLLLGTIDGFQGRKEQGLAAFAEAERLYRASSNKEGEIEVLIRRGSLLNSVSDFAAAHATLERAREAATSFESPSQRVRAEIELGSVMASEGQLSSAEQVVSAAVKTARDAGLETIAADGLVNLAGALSSTHPAEAETHAQEAIKLAERRKARRTLALAETQLASLMSSRGANPADVLRTLDPALGFFREHKYRKFELIALLVASRAYKDLDDIPKARELAGQALQEAEATGNEYQLAIASNNLASQATALGALPEALALRERAEAIHRRQHDTTQLAFDLTNRAELLINLGRFEDAEIVLTEIDDGARRGVEAYVPRLRRVAFLRALASAISNRFSDAAARLAAIPPGPPSSSTSIVASAIGEYVTTRQGRSSGTASGDTIATDPATDRERQLWIAAAARARGDKSRALPMATAGFEQSQKIGSDELSWRFAALGSAAARDNGNQDQRRALRRAAIAALARLRTSWGDHVRRYLARPDLIELRKASELED